MKAINVKAPALINPVLITLPLSKSISNRMLIMGYLAGDHQTVKIPDCDDSLTMKSLLDQLKSGEGQVFDSGDAGTVFRFLTALFSIIPGDRTLRGSARMHQRPVGPLVDALKRLGASINYTGLNGFPPLLISGVNNLATDENADTIEVDGSLSSQFISALLMIAPYLKGGLIIETKSQVSRPYIDMTISLMKECGIIIESNANVIKVFPGQYSISSNVYEADWSAASYWFSLVALSKYSEIVLNGLKNVSTQGDSVLPELYKPLGVVSQWTTEGFLKLSNSAQYAESTEVNLINNPDLAPAYAVACAGLQVQTHIMGLHTLTLKESNRLETIKEGLVNTGFNCSIKDTASLLIQKGRGIPKVNNIKTHNDHRIAMAMSILSIAAGELMIDDSLVVNKSYPHFWNHLKMTGFSIDPQ